VKRTKYRTIIDQRQLMKELNQRLEGDGRVTKNACTFFSGVIESSFHDILLRADDIAARDKSRKIRFTDVQAAIRHHDLLNAAFGRHLAEMEPSSNQGHAAAHKRMPQRPLGERGRSPVRRAEGDAQQEQPRSRAPRRGKILEDDVPSEDGEGDGEPKRGKKRVV